MSLELDIQSDAVAVPTRAVLAGQQGNYVFVIARQIGKVRAISVGRAVANSRRSIRDWLRVSRWWSMVNHA